MDFIQPKPGFLSVKNITKFCLVYYITLLVLILIFTAINNEELNESQTRWWWAFIISLVITTAMSSTALFIMIYTDYFRASYIDNELDPSGTVPRTRLPQPTEQSNTYKTVLTISSRDPNSSSQQPAVNSQIETEAQAPIDQNPNTSGFINLTAPRDLKKEPNVTVVDLPAINALKNILIGQNESNTPPNAANDNDIKLPSNLAAIPSTIAKNTENARKDKKRTYNLRQYKKRK